jgi:hypothetical protein
MTPSALSQSGGTIEPGKIASLVLIKKSPLESVDAFDSITTVWVHGNAVPPATLAANSTGGTGRSISSTLNVPTSKK